MSCISPFATLRRFPVQRSETLPLTPVCFLFLICLCNSNLTPLNPLSSANFSFTARHLLYLPSFSSFPQQSVAVWVDRGRGHAAGFFSTAVKTVNLARQPDRRDSRSEFSAICLKKLLLGFPRRRSGAKVTVLAIAQTGNNVCFPVGLLLDMKEVVNMSFYRVITEQSDENTM